jgi:hypothetical protein
VCLASRRRPRRRTASVPQPMPRIQTFKNILRVSIVTRIFKMHHFHPFLSLSAALSAETIVSPQNHDRPHPCKIRKPHTTTVCRQINVVHIPVTLVKRSGEGVCSRLPALQSVKHRVARQSSTVS